MNKNFPRRRAVACAGSPVAMLAAALIVITPAFAQQVSDKEISTLNKEISTLGVITVTAGRGSDLENLPLSTTVIPRQEVINQALHP